MISSSISIASFPEPANEAMLFHLVEACYQVCVGQNHPQIVLKIMIQVHQKGFCYRQKIAFMYYAFDIGLEQHNFRVPAVAWVQ